MTGEHMTVQVGERFEVSLAEPGTTGFRWQLAQAPPHVLVEADRYDAPAAGPRGASGRRVVALRADAPGDYDLTFALVRPHDGRVDAEHRVHVVATAA